MIMKKLASDLLSKFYHFILYICVALGSVSCTGVTTGVGPGIDQPGSTGVETIADGDAGINDAGSNNATGSDSGILDGVEDAVNDGASSIEGVGGDSPRSL